MIIVELPDGKKAKFPDGTSEEQIKQALASEGLFKQQTPLGGQGPGTVGGFGQTPAVNPFPDTPELFEAKSSGVETGFADLPVPDQLKLSAGLVLSLDDEQRKGLLTSAFGDVSFETKDGVTKATLPNGADVILNKPGFSRQDAFSLVGTLLSAIPAGKVINVFKSLPTLIRSLVSGSVTLATSVAQDLAVDKLGGNTGVDPARAFIGGGIGAGIPFAGNIINRSRLGPFSRDLGIDEQAIREGLETQANPLVQETRIPAAQVLNQPGISRAFQFVQSNSSTTRQAARKLTELNDRVQASLNKFLDDLSPPTDLVTAAEKIRKTARQIIQTAKEERTKILGPLFKNAFREANKAGTKVDVGPIARRLLALQRDASGPARTIYKKLGKELAKQANPARGQRSNLLRLDNFRKQLGAEIERIQNKINPSGIDRSVARELSIIKDQLTKKMAQESPAFGEALRKSAQVLDEISKLEASPIGQLAKLTDEQLAAAAGKIFGPSSNPGLVSRIGDQIRKADPLAWREIVRAEIEKRALTVAESLPGSNFAANLPRGLSQAIFGRNPQQEKMIFSALTGEEAKNARFLKEMLEIASRARVTSGKEATQREAEFLFGRTIGQTFAEMATFFRKGLLGATGERGDAAFARKVFDMLFEPDSSRLIEQARRLAEKGKIPESRLVFLQALRGLVDGQEG